MLSEIMPPIESWGSAPVPVLRVSTGTMCYVHRIFDSGQAVLWNCDERLAELVDADSHDWLPINFNAEKKEENNGN